MALAVLLAAGVALAEIRIGTDFAETLVGTNSADLINGKGGNDTLKGLAANDTYHFDDGFGADTLTEAAFVKVGKKKKPGGVDTLNFSQFDEAMVVSMISQWVAQEQGFNSVNTAGGRGSVDLGSSPVENVVGGSASDFQQGGSAKNTYNGGPGGNDELLDLGGDDGGGPQSLPALAASDDTFKGFTSATGNDTVTDLGGTADKLDLRPLESSDVYVDAIDLSGDGTNDSLRIIINATTSVTVEGHLVPTDDDQENGRMEQIIFSNEVVTSAAELNSLM